VATLRTRPSRTFRLQRWTLAFTLALRSSGGFWVWHANPAFAVLESDNTRRSRRAGPQAAGFWITNKISLLSKTARDRVR
jgi:hypothetical protein